MRLLLDTHAAIWWAEDSRRLSATAIAALEESDNTVLLSAVVIWEVAIKRALGKLDAPAGLEQALLAGGAEPLEISFGHVRRVEFLPQHHGDPFDRLLIAQAQAEDAALVTADPRIRRYDVRVVW